MTWPPKLAYADPVDVTGELTDAELKALFDAVYSGDVEVSEAMLDAVEEKLAGQEATPTDAASARRLKNYWVRGKGGQIIKWGTSGDFGRCVGLVSKYMTTEQAKGYCNLRHKDALGYYPATHAAREKGTKAARLVTWHDVVAAEVKMVDRESGTPTAKPATAVGGKRPPPGKKPPAAARPKTERASQNNNSDFNSKHPRKGGRFAPKGSKDDDGKGVNNQGLSDEQVKKLQQQLRALGYNIAVDGKIGPKTRDALRKFQGDHGMTVSGRADSTTSGALRPLDEPTPTGKKRRSSGGGGSSSGSGSSSGGGTPKPKNGSGAPVKLNRSGVMRVQKLLQSHSGGGLVKQDGEIGPKTTAAIKLYQRKIGVTPTGVLDRPTYQRLTSKNPVPKPKAGRKDHPMATAGSLEEMADRVRELLDDGRDEPVELLATYPDRVYYAADGELLMVGLAVEGEGDEQSLVLAGEPTAPPEDDTVAAELAAAQPDEEAGDGDAEEDDGDDGPGDTVDSAEEDGDGEPEGDGDDLEGKGLYAELPGTLEAVQSAVREAAREKYMPAPAMPGQDRPSSIYVTVVGTYTDKVIVRVCDESSGGDEDVFYSVPYTFADGTVTLGEGVQVAVTAQLEPAGAPDDTTQTAAPVVLSAKGLSDDEARHAARLALERLAVEAVHSA